MDSVTLDQCGGVIGMTSCPGWEQTLDADLTMIKDWGARALVSLMEKDEMDWLGVADIPEKTMELGMAHFHLPIVDMDVPDEEFERNWVESGQSIRNILLSGESIVIHCLAGLGRTGTIAARLLIEFGIDADTAINQIRVERPGTIQTIMQETYIRLCKPVDL